jgi:hypothetical protein
LRQDILDICLNCSDVHCSSALSDISIIFSGHVYRMRL